MHYLLIDTDYRRNKMWDVYINFLFYKNEKWEIRDRKWEMKDKK
jgi:hypothetical protein